MGTKLELENCLPGYSSMRDLARDTNGGSWPVYYGDNGFPNGQLYYGFLPKINSDAYPGHGKDIVKRMMLEHETIFKNQVHELHRLYKVQKDMMDELKRKEECKLQPPYSTSSSSSPLPSQARSEGAAKWNATSFPSGNSVLSKPHASATGIVQAPVNEITGRIVQVGSPASSSIPRDYKASESRPTKLRRKMLDLELPASEYIDGDEFEQCGETPGPCDTNPKSAFDCAAELFQDLHEKMDCKGNGTTSDSQPAESKILADLNEPVVEEEPTSFAFVEFSRTSMARDGNSGACFSDLQREIPPNLQHGSINGISNIEQFQNRRNDGGWLNFILEADQSREKFLPIHQSSRVGEVPVLTQQRQFLLETTRQTPGFHPFHHSKGDTWRTTAGVERYYSHPDNNYSKSFVPAEGVIPSSFTYSSGWFNSSSGLVKGHASNAARANFDFGSEMPVRNGFYHGPRDLVKRDSHANADLISRGNGNKSDHASGGFFGISSPYAGTSSNKDQNLNIILPNGFSSYQNSSMIVARDPKLVSFHPSMPWVTANGACSKEAANPSTALNSMQSALVRTPSQWCSDIDLKKPLDRLNSLASSSHKGTRHEAFDRSGRMILGVPIYENSLVSKMMGSSSAGGPSFVPPSSQGEEITKVGFDINVPCDPTDSDIDKTAAQEAFSQEKRGRRGASLRGLIDLNSFATEDDVLPGSTDMKRAFEIDLEAPVGPEETDSYDDDAGKGSSTMSQNPSLELPQRSTEEVTVVAELARTAAATIVDISASIFRDHLLEPMMEDSSQNPLHRFVNLISSPMDASKRHLDTDASNNRLDESQDDSMSNDSGYFESMTLKLTECDADEYLSKPSEVPYPKSTETHVSGNRRRGGQARRGGRQRRDFQRDILPGLVSLSRHEVTEDLQTFGGLMRATGHVWHSSPRRNGSARGRRRSVAVPVIPPEADTERALLKQKLGNVATIQVRHEDTSLIGWGRTTRRHRRLRFPAGSPAAAADLT